MDAGRLRDFEALSLFEIKDELIRLAAGTSAKAASTFLNAGRGNPNWLSTTPREAFFLLGQFAIGESRRVLDLPEGLGGLPARKGIARRIEDWLERQAEQPAAGFLLEAIHFAVDRFQFDPDEFVHELADAACGDHYPIPPRILRHNEAISRDYLRCALGGGAWPAGRLDLFAVEGATAGICYLLRTLRTNRLLLPGDRVALGTPILTPYLDLPRLEDAGLETVEVQAAAADGFQYGDAELAKLLDPRVKAFVLVNPGNPTGVAIDPPTMAKIVRLVRTRRPDLLVITDDVYGSFVPEFRSLLAELPGNTIGLYSYSKYFGCTGWRLGLVALHQDHLVDRRIAALPEPVRLEVERRYASLAVDPGTLRFIDRLVADSRGVALNHTAGLSGPQQVMMMLFGLSELMDLGRAYQAVCIDLLHRRFQALMGGLGIHPQPDRFYDAYYGLIDLEAWLTRHVGPKVAAYVRDNVHPLDIVFKLAESHGIVLLNGGGFHAPDWSARVSFANLDDEVYAEIGRAMRAVARGYLQTYRAVQAARPGPADPPD
ncbi:bifunctional aspartate transaminase/aspartate 4-decarboxylase [Geminicoccus roseus]|uniref:bifunctional aspartate transaminase/aspartate 4-decarboxylase n=1 Tax=Geminicoccus roseus TaxID=404900 RepID=UPI0003FCAE0D|nr:bifunctional aspartate transaminase/aspartate 4-decarboxylase [Geminicoccus roseus]